LLIYTKHDELDRAGDDFKVLTGYSYHSICNLPLRLVNDVFTVLSTFPHNKNNNFNL
jgi:hypothetical protein